MKGESLARTGPVRNNVRNKVGGVSLTCSLPQQQKTRKKKKGNLKEKKRGKRKKKKREVKRKKNREEILSIVLYFHFYCFFH